MGPASASCSVCGEPLGAKRVCFACLLRAGLDDAEQPVPPEPAALFDDFEIARREDGSLWELGRGAMGVTYRATEKPLHRQVALKVIELHGSEAVRERFLREARAAAALRHPNVAGVFRFGAMADADRCYCAMELVEGETLDALVRREGPLKLELALEIAIQIARALTAAAERQLVHRDLKPGNIMLSPSENSPAKVEVKVIDFGLAKAASAAGQMELTHGEFVGTPAFASPEQFAGGAIDARTDIYALGVTLWFALSGRLPFLGRTIEEIRQRQSEDKLPLEQLTGVPRCVVDLLKSCLATDPSERPSSARVLLKELEECKAEAITTYRKNKVAILAGIAVILLGIAALMLWRNKQHDLGVPTIVPEKSIAVLPFENLSDDKANSYFADGIQDEILTRLSKIGELKVISRTSTQSYKSAPRNLPEIARQLGVSTILEGTVQKDGDKVRVNVQLIKAASDAHLWAETYDRKLTDIFSVESDVAKAIAEQLQAKLTGDEQRLIAAKPTDNPEAYDAYLRGLAYSLKTANTTANALSAQKYLKEAVRLDPKFALAWALLSYVEARGYRTEFLQPTDALREEARQAAETALTLQPNLGEAVLAKGFYHYACLRDYDTAVRYFEEARPLLPNSSRVPESLAYVTRKQGQWERSESYFNEAERLDPRNVSLLTQHALSYKDRRLFAEASRKLEQILNITPDDPDTIVEKAVIAQAEGDLPRASALLAPLHVQANDSNALETQIYQAILERRPAPMIPRLEEMLAKPDPALGYTNGELRFWLGWAQDVAGDHTGAQASWEKARRELESFLKEHPQDHILLGDLALTVAGLGDKAAAFGLAEQAMAAVPVEKDAVSGPTSIEVLARVSAQLGETDRAVAAFSKLMTTPYSGALGPGAPLTPALLRLDPMFDSLRKDSRFEKVVVDAEQALRRDSAERTVSAKSIAVLPFENLSRDPDNVFFTDGVQDEILADLARVADLKVISRTSVMQYREQARRNLRQIGNELGVANVLEGSVQRSGNRVRVTAQLIDARNDAHLWAQTYDRDLADVFAIQSEIAKAIADQLQAKLSPSEKSAIERVPTADLTAFDLYSRAKPLLTLNISDEKTNFLKAIELLNEATKRDSSFFDAYCQLAYAHDRVYFTGYDHTPARLALAEAAIQTAFRLRPAAGESHLSRAWNLYWGYLDYDGALGELEVARQTLPNDPQLFLLKAAIERRKGHWEESMRNFERAVELDPRNTFALHQAALNYLYLRRYPDLEALLDRVLAIEPANLAAQADRTGTNLDWHADTRPMHQMIDSIQATNPGALPRMANPWLICALAERDAAAAEKALNLFGENKPTLSNNSVSLTSLFVKGVIARMSKDEDKARLAFTAARAEQEKTVQAQPNYGPAWCVLGLIDAGLGRKEEALREGRRAVELLPVEKDAINGAAMIKYFSVIAAWVGETGLACEQLAIAIRYPGSLSYGQLKLFPFWDPLQSDPRFAKLLEEAKLPIVFNPAGATAPEKSIAVLPFESLSEEKANAYFAEGIQDEILTRLSRIADLKVISRTSTRHYNSAPADLPEIAKQLGVAYALEGSVQKVGDNVRVNVQLIKAASDSHVWAETFDRKLTDIFSVESEVAKAIADQLQAKLTGQEEQVLAAKPTDNPQAYDAYLRGLAYSLKPANTTANILAAQKHLREAVRLDPKFALAWALLSSVDSSGYLTKIVEPTDALREEALHGADTALALNPNLGEGVLAKGRYHYGCLKDYDAAIRYYEQARQLLPNDSRISESLAYVTRRRGQWEKSETYFNDAERLDVRNANLFTQHALSYMRLRRFPEALRKLDQVLNITPDDVHVVAYKASIAQGQGDLAQAAKLLAPLHPTADDPGALETQVYQAILERRPANIIPRLQEILAKPDPELGYLNGDLRFWLGWAQQVAGDRAAAEKSWQQARSDLESYLKEQPQNANILSDLALTNMGLGDKSAALAFAERAIAANPLEKDAVSGPSPIETLARVAAQMGEHDRAIDALQKLLSIPAVTDTVVPITSALLRLDPVFDPLRNDPRFEKILAENETTSPTAASAKSIAVLPFENRSSDPENAFFTDGVQDEILTDLARVADLKVISRTSVMQYRNVGQRNLRQIANELGVANVVEGSVQRAGSRVRVNAQLIDASTDAHLWAQTYDRDLADVFAIQSEIAKAIADQLQAKLSPNEKSEIEQAPTKDVTAFDFYSHAKNLFLNAFGSSTGKADLLQAVDLLNQAIARDPSFFEAYCQLAFTQASIYFLDFDHTPSRLAAADGAVQTAARLRPDAGETHLARARILYWGHSDYSGALAELEIARQSLPSESWIFSFKGYIERRQGRWQESLRDLERAIALDPRNLVTLQQTARSYSLLHRYAESKSTLARLLSFEPNDAVTKVLHAFVELDSNANAGPVLEVIDSVRRTNPAAIQNVSNNWLICSLAERNAAAAKVALAACGENPILLGTNENVIFPRSFAEGMIAQLNHDDEKARAAFATAHAEQEKIVQAQPTRGPALCVLGLIDASLGRKEEALQEGRRAVELARADKDAVLGATMMKYLAIIAAWVGDKDLACNQLAPLTRDPSNVTYGQLKLMPFWDPLRADPRFQKILTSLAP